MKLSEAMKTGKRFRPTSDSCSGWRTGESEYNTYLEYTDGFLMDSAGNNLKLYPIWMEWDWELEPEEMQMKDQGDASICISSAGISQILKGLAEMNKRVSRLEEYHEASYTIKQPEHTMIFGGK